MQPCPDPFADVSAVVAIPVRDEAERIADCLIALAAQRDATPGVLLLVNNTTDGTMAAVAEITPSLGCPVHVIEHRFEPEAAHAGQARRLAMQLADQMAPDGLPLLTTDADGRAEPDWLAASLHHLRRGIDGVFGRAEIDPVEAARIPPSLHQADAEEGAYAAVLDQIACLIDPEPDDPWPRHVEHPGASIGVTRTAFRHVGGVPAVALGEDRAFHAALRRADARLRHAPEVRVVVSGRILGRAEGGMADTIRRRLVAPDTTLDDALEPVLDRVRRLRLRRAVRLAVSGEDTAGLAAVHADAVVPGRFGVSWAAIDATYPSARVKVADLPQQMALALRLRDSMLVAEDALTHAG